MRTPILVGKTVSSVSRLAKRGTGSTWPGHLALKLDANLVRNLLQENPNLKLVLVAGTNGKTTTTKLIQDVLESQNKKVFRNATGANLLNGIASTLIKHATLKGTIHYDVALLEIDENSLPVIINELSTIDGTRVSIILLNLFRDQLDRYGEVNTIAKHWQEAVQTLPDSTHLVTNGDDPMLRYIGENSGVHSFYFGLDEKHMKKMDAPHDVDFLYCPHCGNELTYSKRSYSHMGIYKCPKCKYSHKEVATFPDLPNPLFGIYNKYNINAAAVLLQKAFGIDPANVRETLEKFAPAFGRQETIEYHGKHIFLLLSKNPTGFNQSIEAILEQDKNPNVLLLLNDRIPDGRDISWIWDVEFEALKSAKHISIAGDRAYDMGLRIKYGDISASKYTIFEDLKTALNTAAKNIEENETLYILANYSAMLETRKILLGKAIL